MESEKFNAVIGLRSTLLEIQKTQILKNCPECSAKVSEHLSKIQDYLEEKCEMVVIT